VQQWRHFCAATTADHIDRGRCVDSAVELLAHGLGAQVCVVRITAPGAACETSAGLISAELHAAIIEAERTLAAPDSEPLRQPVGLATLISLPLGADDSTLGFLHVALAEPIAEHDDLELVAQLLATALTRSIRPARTRRSSAQRLLSAQQRIARTLSADTTIDATLAGVAEALQAELRCDQVELWLVDPATQRLDCAASWPIAAEQARTMMPARRWAERIHADAAPLSLVEAEAGRGRRMRSVCGAPIRSKRGVEGAIVLLHRRRRTIDSALLDLLDSAGRQLGQLIELRRAERSLQRQNDAALLTLNIMSEAVIITNAQGLLEFVNPAFATMVGRPIEGLLGRAPAEFALEEDQPLLAQALDLRYGDSAQRYEIRLRHADGRIVDTLTTGVPRVGQRPFGGAVALITDQTARKRTEAETARLTDALRIERDRLLRREVEVRTQIGRDLHDGPVQQVAVAVMSTQYVRRVAQHEPERLGQALDDLQEQLQRATQDLRTVLYELRPLGIVEEGLVTVLRQYVARMRASPTLRLHLHAPTTLRRLAPDHEAAVFIIMQEAVNNVRKHAQARDVWLSLREDADALYAEVRDNGRGFDVQQMQASYIQRGSFGLLNMHERAQLIGGSCTIISQPGQGSSVQLRIPFAPSDEQNS
jgi:PAS domain S-box-containing protein